MPFSEILVDIMLATVDIAVSFATCGFFSHPANRSINVFGGWPGSAGIRDSTSGPKIAGDFMSSTVNSGPRPPVDGRDNPPSRRRPAGCSPSVMNVVVVVYDA